MDVLRIEIAARLGRAWQQVGPTAWRQPNGRRLVITESPLGCDGFAVTIDNYSFVYYFLRSGSVHKLHPLTPPLEHWREEFFSLLA